jgi:pantoate--beta-alanine ligase
MQIITTIAALREMLAQKKPQDMSVVPTMGALHDGHMALLHAARAVAKTTIVTLFVNPIQFAADEDFDRYPRTMHDDAALLEKNGADFIFAPSVEEMYPSGFATQITVNGIDQYLCGPFRKGHFTGVATIVAKLLNAVGAGHAFFGEKDWQQLQLIKRLVVDLSIPTIIHGVPTVREDDGLARSSRNRYLDDAARAKAALIPITLQSLAQDLRSNGASLTLAMIEQMLRLAASGLKENGFILDYLELADAQTCAPVRSLKHPARLFIAAHLDQTRLIDNWPV